MGGSLVVHRDGRKNPYWIKYIKGRIKKNKNFLAATFSPPGSGKSSATLAIAEMLDSDFDVDNIVFSIEDLVELVHSGKPIREDRTKLIKEVK